MLHDKSTYYNARWRTLGILSLWIVFLALPLYTIIRKPWLNEPVQHTPEFVGNKTCVECHQVEYEAWLGSHHDRAMEIATDSTVRGNFNNVNFRHKGKTHHFFKKDHKFFVNTEGPDGAFRDYEITHTFGYEPLQQYLVPFPDGRYQCLPLAWDTEKESWYQLGDTVYPDEELQGDNWLFWTNQAQNWNSMCADCHSTNLQKNYDPVTKTYNTTFSEIDVSCEACHGPASEHLKWAALPENSRPQNVNTGLIIQTSNIDNEQFVNLCVRCHSRRSIMGDFHNQTTEPLDLIIPQLPVDPHYFVDGQILNEDYVYASFTQSKMFTKDVSCKDCHDVHSTKLKMRGNDLCLQCHQPALYDTPAHHFHKMPGANKERLINNTGEPGFEEGEGALCVNCHMDGRFYMGNDYRRDHSFRIPRPDLTLSLGTPNACNNCHKEETAEWAQSYIRKWYGEKERPHYGSTFAAAHQGDTSVLSALLDYGLNEVYPLMVRTAAIQQLRNYNNTRVHQALETLLTDPHALIRHSALESYSSNDLDTYLKHTTPLLDDQTKAVRTLAASRLSALPKEQLSAAQKKKLALATTEYEKANLYMADFAGSQYNLGNIYYSQEDYNKAASAYQEATRIDKQFHIAQANLARVYNLQGKNEKALELYKDLVQRYPELHDYTYSLALLLAEMGDLQGSRDYLKKATGINPNDSRTWYNLAIIETNLRNLEAAEASYLQVLQLEPDNFEYNWALAIFYANTQQVSKALEYVNKAEALAPGNEQVLQFKQQLLAM